MNAIVPSVSEIQCLKDVVLDIEPRIVQLGKESTLRCSYNAEGVPLYTVKWYRGHHEFYRYTPKELPATKIFAFPGVHVDVSISMFFYFSCHVNYASYRIQFYTLLFNHLKLLLILHLCECTCLFFLDNNLHFDEEQFDKFNKYLLTLRTVTKFTYGKSQNSFIDV